MMEGSAAAACCPDGRSDVPDPHPRELQTLFASAKCVLFDFDGPICDLFSAHSAIEVAQVLSNQLSIYGVAPALMKDPALKRDPLAMLQAVSSAGWDASLVECMERRLTAEEVRAAADARPTLDADKLVRRLHDAGYVLAVTSNNSAEAASHYLARRRTAGCFGEHVHGRVSDLKLLKPNPDCLRRALESTGMAAADALMIGDSLSDRQAAQRLGVPFIGYAKNDRKRMALGAGASVIVRSLRSLVEAVDWVSAEER